MNLSVIGVSILLKIVNSRHPNFFCFFFEFLIELINLLFIHINQFSLLIDLITSLFFSYFNGFISKSFLFYIFFLIILRIFIIFIVLNNFPTFRIISLCFVFHFLFSDGLAVRSYHSFRGIRLTDEISVSSGLKVLEISKMIQVEIIKHSHSALHEIISERISEPKASQHSISHVKEVFKNVSMLNLSCVLISFFSSHLNYNPS